MWIGGDAVMWWGDGQANRREPKVRRVAGVVMGVAGEGWQIDQALTWDPPRWPGHGDPWRWVVGDAMPTLLQHLRNQMPTLDPNLGILWGVGGTLISADLAGSAHTWEHGFGAIGGGAGPALGAMYAGARYRPRTRLRKALEASEAFVPGVRAPFTIVRA